MFDIRVSHPQRGILAKGNCSAASLAEDGLCDLLKIFEIADKLAGIKVRDEFDG